MHTISSFFNMFVTSVSTMAVQILRGPVNHSLGLQIHVTNFYTAQQKQWSKYRKWNHRCIGREVNCTRTMDQIALKLSVAWTRNQKGSVASSVWVMQPRNMPAITKPLFSVFGLPLGQRPQKITGAHPSWLHTSNSQVAGLELQPEPQPKLNWQML
jgi:hypothetical protein